MPLTRISIRKGKSVEFKRVMQESIYQGLREAFKIPDDDLFMLVHEHDEENFVYSKNYLNIERTDDLLIIQITANNTRTTEQKKMLYAAITKILVDRLAIRPEDVLINLVEVAKENWSFGLGIAQYA